MSDKTHPAAPAPGFGTKRLNPVEHPWIEPPSVRPAITDKPKALPKIGPS